jgi:dGTPase
VEDLAGLSLPALAMRRAFARQTSMRGGIIDLLVSDLYEQAQKQFREERIRTLEDVYDAREPILLFSQSVQPQIQELRVFLRENMYMHPRVLEASEKGQRIILVLCNVLLEKPTDKILALQEQTRCALPEAVKDYVAGMTDAYAWEQATEKRLL